MLPAPAKTPEAIVKKLHQEALAALKLADVQEAMGRQGLEVTTNNNPAEFAALIRNETAIWADVIKTAGIKAG